MTIEINNISKIYLSCKRGMLELDLILLTFMEHTYLKLPTKLKWQFIALLNESDQELYKLLLGQHKSKKLNNIIKHIKKSNSLLKFH